jgi:hypothetical protein
VMGSLSSDNSSAGTSVNTFELSNQHLNLNNFKKSNIRKKIILENPIYLKMSMVQLTCLLSS